MKTIHREPMTSDLIFKAVFGRDTEESRQALAALLNLVLDREDDPIIDVVVKNPFSITEAVNGKTIVMDIKVETSRGEIIDIEMQVNNLEFYIDRSVYYACEQLVEGLDRGLGYDDLKPSIVISFVKGKLFSHTDKFHTVYTLRENVDNWQLTDVLKLHYIELDKIKWKEREIKEMSPLERFCTYMLCSGDDEESRFIDELTEEGGVIQMADKILKKVSEEERLYHLRISREKAEMDIQLGKAAARREGIKEGIKEGRAETLTIMVQKMKELDYPTAQICQITGLSEKEINDL